MNRLGDYAIGYQGSDDPFENYIDEYPIATKREIWKQAHREATEEVAKAHRRGWEADRTHCWEDYHLVRLVPSETIMIGANK